MSEYVAKVEWTLSQGESFATNHYSRAHRWHFDGGAVIEASSSPSVVPLPWSLAEGVDPEEALVASASSCHMLWFLSLAAKAGHVVLSYSDDAIGTMAKDERGRMAMTSIVLAPKVTFAEGKAPDAVGLKALHREAHDECFIANSLRTPITISDSA